MAFVNLGGNDSTHPTFFEALAADKLLPSLRSALTYTLSVRACSTSCLRGVLGSEAATHTRARCGRPLPLGTCTPSMKNAQVLSQRHPIMERLLAYEDEVVALVLLAVDAHSLSATDGTLAESLYGLKRRPLRPRSNTTAADDVCPTDVLSPRHKHASLLLEVCVGNTLWCVVVC
jgi:peroxin-12